MGSRNSAEEKCIVKARRRKKRQSSGLCHQNHSRTNSVTIKVLMLTPVDDLSEVKSGFSQLLSY